MSSQQKSLLLDSPTKLAGVKRSLTNDAADDNTTNNSTNEVQTVNVEVGKGGKSDAIEEDVENGNVNANVDADAIDTVRVHKKSKSSNSTPLASVDVEAEKDAFVQQAAQLKNDSLDIKEQTEATLDKLNEVHCDLVKSTNALLSAVDPNLTELIKDTENRIKSVEDAVANADAEQLPATAEVADSEEVPVEVAAVAQQPPVEEAAVAVTIATADAVVTTAPQE